MDKTVAGITDRIRESLVRFSIGVASISSLSPYPGRVCVQDKTNKVKCHQVLKRCVANSTTSLYQQYDYMYLQMSVTYVRCTTRVTGSINKPQIYVINYRALTNTLSQC
jgi:hypothetical protein